MTQSGADLIRIERQRQVSVEEYDAKHDEGHAWELTRAAGCYADNTAQILAGLAHVIPGADWHQPNGEPAIPDFQDFPWPWAPEFWKPTGNPIRDLVKAGALIAAALDALIAEQQTSPQKEDDHAES